MMYITLNPFFHHGQQSLPHFYSFPFHFGKLLSLSQYPSCSQVVFGALALASSTSGSNTSTKELLCFMSFMQGRPCSVQLVHAMLVRSFPSLWIQLFQPDFLIVNVPKQTIDRSLVVIRYDAIRCFLLMSTVSWTASRRALRTLRERASNPLISPPIYSPLTR